MALSTMVCESVRNVVQDPLLLPRLPTLLTSPWARDHPLIKNGTQQLIRWLISDNHVSMDLSQTTHELLMWSWSKGTSTSYNSDWKWWHSWCLERQIDSISASLGRILDFWSWMHKEGGFSIQINVHRSAISSLHHHVDGVPVGQHFLVKHLMKGISRANSPLPKYKDIWDVDQFLQYIDSLRDNKDWSWTFEYKYNINTNSLSKNRKG